MSDKVRVLFKVPESTKNAHRLYKPVEIPIEEYIQFRVDERNGSKDYMASYVSTKFLKGADVNSASVEMITAVGNPFYILEIDQQIENGINPLDHMSDDDDDDDDDNDYESNYESDEDEDNDDSVRSYSDNSTKSSNTTNHQPSPANKKVALIIILSMVIIPLLIFLIIGLSL